MSASATATTLLRQFQRLLMRLCWLSERHAFPRIVFLLVLDFLLVRLLVEASLLVEITSADQHP